MINYRLAGERLNKMILEGNDKVDVIFDCIGAQYSELHFDVIQNGGK